MAAGVGGLLHGLAVGGKRDTLHGEPVLVTGVVTTLSDGEWSDTGLGCTVAGGASQPGTAQAYWSRKAA